MQEILLTIAGRKLPVEVTDQQLDVLERGGELTFTVTAFPDGKKIKLSNDDGSHEVVYLAKIISIA